MNPYEIIDKYYPENTQQRQILVIHSLAVSGKAMKMLDAHPELRLNRSFVKDLSNSNIEVLDGIERITGIRPEFIKLDLKDKEGTREALKAHPGIKGIILFAASKAVGESVQQPLKYYRNNVVTLVNLLELMPEFNIEGIVFSSSCTVYGQPDPEMM